MEQSCTVSLTACSVEGLVGRIWKVTTLLSTCLATEKKVWKAAGTLETGNLGVEAEHSLERSSSIGVGMRI